MEPSPGRGTAESAAERRLHAVVDTLGLHVYSGETHPDDSYVTTVSLTPARSLLGLTTDGIGIDDLWMAAVHPEDAARYAEVFSYANERLLHPLELEYRLCGYDGVERWVWERIFPHRLREDGIIDLDGVVADVTALHEATHERNDLSQRLERVLGGVAEFVVSCEIRDGRTVWVHPGPGIERMLGGPLPDGADGPSVWSSCVHPDDRPMLDAFFERLAEREPAEATYRLIGLDGVERWVWARARPHAGAGAIAYDVVISDVTERERARIGLLLAREEAERRSRVDPTTGLFNRHHLLDVARRELARSQREHTTPALVLLDVDRLRELNERRGHAVGDAVLRELAGRLSHSVRTYDTISHVGAGRFGVLVPDLRDPEALPRICDEIAATMAGEPLRTAGRELPVSVTAAGARAHRGTTVDALLHTAELALERAKRGDASSSTPEGDDERWDAPVDAVDAVEVAATLARAAAVREGVPHEHEVGVAELAELVGRELGLPESLQGDLRLAGLLHDVGTIAVAGAVLSKPGPLDEAEWALLREHPGIGADMVARIPGLARTQLAIRHHHERFDGHGYPDRLVGEAIPMAARVLATVDAFTAMTEARPYRDARDRDDAMEELRRNAGTQLDPAVVEALCRVLAGTSAGKLAA